jgi:predicted ATPase
VTRPLRPARRQWARPALLHGLYWLPNNIAAETPIVLLSEDLHWSDAESLRLLPISPRARQAVRVTRKTVETHLGHVYRKLEITSRHALAAALGEHNKGPPDASDHDLHTVVYDVDDQRPDEVGC